MKNKLVVTLVIIIAAVLIAATISVILPGGKDDGVHYPATAFNKDAKLAPTGKGSTIEGLGLSIKSYELAAEYPYIEILWKNETDRRATYGLGYDIQKQVDGVWGSCAAESVIVPSIACMIAPGEENEHKYNLSFFDIDKGGKYRFTAECYLPDENAIDGTARCDMYVEFEVR